MQRDGPIGAGGQHGGSFRSFLRGVNRFAKKTKLVSTVASAFNPTAGKFISQAGYGHGGAGVMLAGQGLRLAGQGKGRRRH